MKITEIITDKQIERSWGYASFGAVSKRDIIKYTLLKFACGYHSGHTAEVIVNELRLLTKKRKLTKKGCEYLYEAFSDGNNI